jgi:solute carrier family 30 (zinc transporter), member 5/7
MFVEIIVGW